MLSRVCLLWAGSPVLKVISPAGQVQAGGTGETVFQPERSRRVCKNSTFFYCVSVITNGKNP